MTHYHLEPPEVMSHEETADDRVCFHIKKSYGVLTGAITRHRVRWKDCSSGDEWTRLFENPNITQLEIDGLRNGREYEFHFESGSRVRFGKSVAYGPITLQNWNEKTLNERLANCTAVIGRLDEWAENTKAEITEKVFNENKTKIFKPRSSLFARLSSPVKFSSKASRGIYLAFVGMHENRILTTPDQSVPLVRVDKGSSMIGDELMKWIGRLPPSYRDLIAYQRMSEECALEDSTDGAGSIERRLLRTLISVLSFTCYKKFDFYHFRPIQLDDAAVVVVGALGPSEFVETLQWSSVESTETDDLQTRLVRIGRFHAQLNRQLQPGLYVADFRLVSDIKQIYVKTSGERPTFPPCTFVRSNSHVNAIEWSWLKPAENSEDTANGDQLEFYRKFFAAVEKLLGPYAEDEPKVDYFVYNDFLLEFGQISMILIYPNASNIVVFESSPPDVGISSPELIPGCQFEREYLRQILPVAAEKYAKVRALIPVFKQVMKTPKTTGKRFRVWHSSVQQNIEDAEKMLSKFDTEITWLERVVSKARKAGPHATELRELQQRFELLGILCFTPKQKLTRISIVVTFVSLYPIGTTMLIQLKPETRASEVTQLMLQRCFTKNQLKQLDANDFYLSVLYGARERRLRDSVEVSTLDEPWAAGEFCLKCCASQELTARLSSTS